ncbi:hypothetical protein SH139x_003305 [Planctomycetaceae bacterium SH139]
MTYLLKNLSENREPTALAAGLLSENREATALAAGLSYGFRIVSKPSRTTLRFTLLVFTAICITFSTGISLAFGQASNHVQPQASLESENVDEVDRYCLRITSKQQPEKAVAIYAQINGRSIEQLEQAAMTSLFTFFDYNQDGLLAGIETHHLPDPEVFAQHLFSPLNPSLAAETVELAGSFTSEQLTSWYKAEGISFVHVGWGLDTSWADLGNSMQELIKDLNLNKDSTNWQPRALNVYHTLDDNFDGVLNAAELQPGISYPSTTASMRLQHRELVVSANHGESRQQPNDGEWLYPNPRGGESLPNAVMHTLSLSSADPDEHSSRKRRFAGQRKLATIAATDILVRLDEGNLERQLVEATENLERLLAESDLNSNGILETTEWNEKSARLIRCLLPQADANRDDALSKREVEQWCELWKEIARSQLVLTVVGQSLGAWEQSDANGNGKLSQAEWLQFLSSQMPIVNGESAKNQPVERQLRITVSIGKPGSLLNTPSLDGPEWFRAADVNQDHCLQREEFVGPLHIFESLDSNQNGFLSSDEAAAAAER